MKNLLVLNNCIFILLIRFKEEKKIQITFNFCQLYLTDKNNFLVLEIINIIEIYEIANNSQ